MDKSRKGITLLALVVTIIVLLILAGVGISMLTGNNSVIDKAADAKEKTLESQIKEEIEIAWAAAEAKAVAKGLTSEEEETEFKNRLKDSTVTRNGTKLNVTYNGYEATIDTTSGNVTNITKAST